MRLNAFVAAFAFSLVAAAPVSHAQSASDPVFGNDPHAKAVLDCHADYARRFAKALVKTQATPTEVATAAYAHCIGQFNDFTQSLAVAAKSSDNPKVYSDPERYQAGQIARMRDYSFAYTLDTYITSTTAF